MDNFFWIIIVITVIGSLISSAAKKKKREEARRDAQQRQQPQRSMPLSDIEKAFMMAQQQRPPQGGEYTPAPPRPAYTPPPAYAAPQRPAYTPPTQPVQATAYTPMESRMSAPMESRMSAPMESRMSAPMESRMSAPMEARTSAVVPPHPMYASKPSASIPQDLYRGSMGAVSTQGMKDEEGGDPVSIANLDRLNDTDLETISLESPTRAMQPVTKPARKGAPLKLFENKNEYVKAVIYSEVLARRTAGRAHSAHGQ